MTVEAYPPPWRNNRHEMYIQLCYPSELEACNPKLYALIEKYGEAFDDEWFYYYNRPLTIIKRVPLW